MLTGLCKRSFVLQDAGGYETTLDPWIDSLFAALPSVFTKAVAGRPATAPPETPKICVRACQPTAIDTSVTSVAANSEGVSTERAERKEEHFRAACSAAAAYAELSGIASGARPWSASPLLDMSPAEDNQGMPPSRGAQEAPSSVSRSIANPFWAEVVESGRLTAADHWQVRCPILR